MIISSHSNFELIVSDSLILSEAINSNLQHDGGISNVTSLESQKILDFSKIDLLIIDADLNIDPLELFHVKTIISLTEETIRGDAIYLAKPIKLAKLIKIVETNRLRQELFSSLIVNSSKFVYDEQLCQLTSASTKIRFTDTENLAFKHLFLAPEISKEELANKVWNSNHDTNSSMVETTISRLKQKLPKEITILAKGGTYKLAPSN